MKEYMYGALTGGT